MLFIGFVVLVHIVQNLSLLSGVFFELFVVEIVSNTSIILVILQFTNPVF